MSWPRIASRAALILASLVLLIVLVDAFNSNKTSQDESQEYSKLVIAKQQRQQEQSSGSEPIPIQIESPPKSRQKRYINYDYEKGNSASGGARMMSADTAVPKETEKAEKEKMTEQKKKKQLSAARATKRANGGESGEAKKGSKSKSKISARKLKATKSRARAARMRARSFSGYLRHSQMPLTQTGSNGRPRAQRYRRQLGPHRRPPFEPPLALPHREDPAGRPGGHGRPAGEKIRGSPISGGLIADGEQECFCRPKGSVDPGYSGSPSHDAPEHTDSKAPVPTPSRAPKVEAEVEDKKEILVEKEAGTHKAHPTKHLPKHLAKKNHGKKPLPKDTALSGEIDSSIVIEGDNEAREFVDPEDEIELEQEVAVGKKVHKLEGVKMATHSVGPKVESTLEANLDTVAEHKNKPIEPAASLDLKLDYGDLALNSKLDSETKSEPELAKIDLPSDPKLIHNKKIKLDSGKSDLLLVVDPKLAHGKKVEPEMVKKSDLVLKDPKGTKLGAREQVELKSAAELGTLDTIDPTTAGKIDLAAQKGLFSVTAQLTAADRANAVSRAELDAELSAPNNFKLKPLTATAITTGKSAHEAKIELDGADLKHVDAILDNSKASKQHNGQEKKINLDREVIAVVDPKAIDKKLNAREQIEMEKTFTGVEGSEDLELDPKTTVKSSADGKVESEDKIDLAAQKGNDHLAAQLASADRNIAVKEVGATGKKEKQVELDSSALLANNMAREGHEMLITTSSNNGDIKLPNKGVLDGPIGVGVPSFTGGADLSNSGPAEPKIKNQLEGVMVALDNNLKLQQDAKRLADDRAKANRKKIDENHEKAVKAQVAALEKLAQGAIKVMSDAAEAKANAADLELNKPKVLAAPLQLAPLPATQTTKSVELFEDPSKLTIEKDLASSKQAIASAELDLSAAKNFENKAAEETGQILTKHPEAQLKVENDLAKSSKAITDAETELSVAKKFEDKASIDASNIKSAPASDPNLKLVEKDLSNSGVALANAAADLEIVQQFEKEAVDDSLGLKSADSAKIKLDNNLEKSGQALAKAGANSDPIKHSGAKQTQVELDAFSKVDSKGGEVKLVKDPADNVGKSAVESSLSGNGGQYVASELSGSWKNNGNSPLSVDSGALLRQGNGKEKVTFFDEPKKTFTWDSINLEGINKNGFKNANKFALDGGKISSLVSSELSHNVGSQAPTVELDPSSVQKEPPATSVVGGKTKKGPLYQSPKVDDLPEPCRTRLHELRALIEDLLILIEKMSQRSLLDTSISYKTRESISRKLAKIRRAAEEARMAAQLANFKSLNETIRIAGVELLRLSKNPTAMKLEPALRSFAQKLRQTFSQYKKACKGVPARA